MNYKYINTDISKEISISPNQVYLEDYLAEFDTEPEYDQEFDTPEDSIWN
jgi:hypothetical protein